MAYLPTPPAAWALLPSDLLALAFAHLPLRPRVRIVALVCRRWRDAVLRSVTCIDSGAPVSLFALPSVTELHPAVRGRWQPLRCSPPPWTRSLTYEPRPASGDADIVHLAKLTGLTRLHLNPHRGSCLGSPELVRLIMRNAASLTELVYNPGSLTAEAIRLILQLRLPKLCSLELHCTAANSKHSVLAAHASQLTHLSTSLNHSLSLPICRSIDTDLTEIFAPALTSVALTFNITDDDPPPSTFPYSALTSLHIERDEHSGVWAPPEWLTKCTALRTLNILYTPPAALAVLPPQPHLHTLMVNHDPLTTVALMHRLQCTQLRALHLHGGELVELCKASPFPYPLLHTLRVLSADMEAIHGVCKVLRECNLRSLDVNLSGGVDNNVGDMLAAAQDRGVEVVVLRLAWGGAEVLSWNKPRLDSWTVLHICV